MLGNDLGPYGSGLKHFYQCLRRLAVVSPQKQGGEVAQAKSVLDPETVRDENVFDEDYAIVLTTAPPGSIPAKIWRASHVIYL
jgi:broad specificity polyphosphatase/5'/3'-nucleotidase SurE